AAAPAAPAAAAPAAVSLDAGEATLADPAEVDKFARQVSKSLISAGKTLRTEAVADASGYLFLRLGVLMTAKAPPAQGGATKVPAPQPPVLKDFETLLGNENWERLLTKAETTLAVKPFWLDLHRYSSMALSNMGKDYEAARDCVLAGAAFYVKRFPEIVDYTFADGSPFANELTREWLSTEVMPSGGGGGGGDGGEGAEVLSKARSLAAGGKVDEALDELSALANGARSGRARFKARLTMAQSLASGTTAATAEGIFDALGSELERLGLEAWEPELAAECYRSHLACLKAMKKEKDPIVSQQTALVYRRLCRVDPLAALKAAG
ncbi:MAG TPA: type VI secretion system domain-containing protein, partial [Sandaracinaceae bacterium LLY-WYZ-13_1]|nr:type VI secretion system domain-containing protein [Sandaracinaceae bacterium LLY-WYZ-13_1]